MFSGMMYCAYNMRADTTVHGAEALDTMKAARSACCPIALLLACTAVGLENNLGSWLLQSIQMANSLKLREYDFHFSFGGGTHNPRGAALNSRPK
jgi:hypothetical protein